VEGLASGDTLHAVQAAFIEHDGFMCGYCTPGFVMAAAALLAHQPHPSRDEIVTGLGGNICRCGAYARILEAVQDAAQRQA
jgi:xanthine dehydrogenase YagT iron-sulfur-binding subunit